MLDVDKFVSELTDAESQLTAREQELNQQLKTVQADLKRIRDARSCLGRKKTTTRTNKRTAPTKQDVRQAIEFVLRDQGVVEEGALKTVVEAKLTECGKSKQGFALRFKEVLASDDFVDTPSGWRIASEEHNSSPDFAEVAG